MKFIILAVIMAVAMANSNIGYLNKFEELVNSSQELNINTDSLIELLKNNFQVMGQDIEESLEDYVKGNLLNPVKMNYMFLIENGQNIVQQLKNHAKVYIESQEDKLLDKIFGQTNEESVLRSTNAQYPKESRVPFYYYKSNSIEQESEYEQDFGVKLEKENSGKSSQYQFLDQRTNKKFGKTFSLQQCIKDNFEYASDYQFKKTGIYKISDPSMKIEITEENAKDVQALMQDLCAVSRLSGMFSESASPNFISFALSYNTISENALTQELTEKMIENAGNNFSNHFGANKVYGQTILVTDLADVQSERVLGKVQPRVLSANMVALESATTTTTDHSMDLIQFWFSVGFVVVLFVTCFAIFKMEIAQDSLIYTKFITTDVK